MRFGAVFLSVSVSSVVFTVSFTDEDCVAADHLDILPTNADSLSLSANPPVFGSAVNNQGNYPSAAGINLNIAHKSQTAPVGFVNHFFASQFSNAAIHVIPLFTQQDAGIPPYIQNIFKNAKNRPDKAYPFPVCEFSEALSRLGSCIRYIKSPFWG